MHSFTFVALPALLGAIAGAVPMVKRDVVWVTETNVDVVTVPVTETVWVNAAGATQNVDTVDHFASSSTKHHHGHVKSTATVAPAAASSTSTPVEATPESTSAYVAPTTSSTPEHVAPTTSEYIAPTTSAYVAPTTSEYVAPSSSEAPTSTATEAATSAGSASGSSYTGDLTFYTPGTGSCGETNTESDPIVALAKGMMTADWTGNPNLNPLCGTKIAITYGGTTKTATIVDTCPGCAGASLDLSPDFFSEFGPQDKGVLSGATWVYV